MKRLLPCLLLSAGSLLATDPAPNPAPGYSLANCVQEYVPAKAERTAAGSQFWFADTDLAHGKTVKLSIVGPHLATHPPHRHAEDEFFFVLEGHAEFFLDGEHRTVGPQTLLYCPSWHLHGIRNVGDQELRYLVIKQYPGPRPKPAPVTADFGAVLRQQLARYPELELQDCYKLVHQACRGSEHAVDDPAAAQRWMDREVANLPPGPAEPLVDPIAPDGRFVRVNLRPFLAAKGNPQRLVDAFVQTAARPAGSADTMADAWNEVVKLAASGALPFTAEAARDYGQRQAAAGWPAVHHSEKYSRLYHPAYRVIARDLVPGAVPEK